MATKPQDVFRTASEAGSALRLARVALTLCVLLAGLNAPAADPALVLPPAVITFDSQTGPYGTVYTGHTESGFTITPTAGVWYESMQYGNPVPSIYTGPPGVPQRSVLQITSTASPFYFGSLDFSSNNGGSTYIVEGHLGATIQFNQFGTLQNPGSGFERLSSNYAWLPLDALLIDVTPGEGTTSLNLDNITLTLTPVPEPSTLSMWAIAVGAMLVSRRRR